MAHSALLRVQDVHAIYQLVGECRELGDDAVLWRRHWFAGLGKLTGAGLVLGAEVADVRAGRTRHLGVADWGWENGFNRLGWDRAQAEMTADPTLSRTPAIAEYLERMALSDGICQSRTDLLRDAEWYRSWDYENLHLAGGVNHTLWCFRSVPGTADEFNGVIMARPVGDRDFTARQKAVVSEAHAVLGPLVGGPLARFCEPSPMALPPRAREVLRCLLEGDTDKQMTARLGLSRHTVNQYTKRIFAHFGASSRPELLARWVRRGWHTGFRWADPD
jgi:DNA-binding CsgD family transcriptional regulator